jgi:hypothetical protein
MEKDIRTNPVFREVRRYISLLTLYFSPNAIVSIRVSLRLAERLIICPESNGKFFL